MNHSYVSVGATTHITGQVFHQLKEKRDKRESPLDPSKHHHIRASVTVSRTSTGRLEGGSSRLGEPAQSTPAKYRSDQNFFD